MVGASASVVIAVPDWVPELSAGIRADVYPVSPLPPAPLPAELVLDRDTVTAGYATHRPPYEFSSLLATAPPSLSALTKVRHALASLRRARPPVLQRAPLLLGIAQGGDVSATSGGSINSATKPSFPLQKPSAKSSLEDWFNRLASGGAFSTSALSKAVPLGPAIVRAVGKVLEMMAARAVPTQRAVWYVRIAVLNECVKQIRPDRPAPSPRIFWTRQLCGLLKTELDALRSKRAPATREYFMHYVLDLARWQGDESLLELAPWLERIIAAVRSDLAQGGSLASTPAGRIALRAAETFAPEFAASRGAARRLVDALVFCVDACGGATAIASPAAAVAAAAAASAAAAAAASVVSASLSSGQSGTADGTPAILPSVTTNERLPPAVRVSALLRALLPGLQSTGALKGDTLASLVASAQKKPASSYPVPTIVEKKTASSQPVQFVSRLLERLPVSGDVAGLCDALRDKNGRDGLGSERESVTFLCAWAVRGPMRSSGLAVPIAAATVAALARGMSDNGKAVQLDSDSVFQSEIWEYTKMLGALRICDGAASATASSPDDGETQQDQFGYFVDPDHDQEDSRMVCLLAQLYHIGQFRLGSYLKEVGRLVAASHESAARLLQYIASLPEPSDRSVADSRRALLRRGQRVVGKSLGTIAADEAAIAAVCSSDVDAAVTHGVRIRASGDHAMALATAEAVVVLVDAASPDQLEQRVLSTIAFLSSSGAQVVAVNWLLETLSGNGNSFVSHTAAACAMVYALENLAAFAASSGQLEPCLLRLMSLYAKYETHPETQTGSETVIAAIEFTAASFCARFSPNSGFGNVNWTRLVANMIAKHDISRRLAAALVLGTADAVDELSDEVMTRLCGAEETLRIRQMETQADWLPFYGPTPDEDVARMASVSSMSAGLKALDEFVSFRGVDDEEAAPPGLGPWVTANAVLGCVVVPAIKRAFFAAEVDAKHLGNVINASMELLRDGIFDHDLCGARSSLALELVALLGAAKIQYPSDDNSQTLNDLLSSPWIRHALLSSASVELIRRFRSRVEALLGGTRDSVVLTRHVLECCVTLFGGPLRSGESNAIDEGVVIRLLTWVEWGTSEALLTAIVDYRSSCAQVDVFGNNVGEAASAMRFCGQARMLVDILLRSVPAASLDIVAIQLSEVALEGLTQGLNALVAHAVVEAGPSGQVVPRLEREGWSTYDATRCAMMSCILPHLKLPATSIVVSISRQLSSGAATLRTSGADGLRPDLSGDGDMFSSAISSRFEILDVLILQSDLHGRSIVLQSEEDVHLPVEEPPYSETDANAIRDCALAVSDIVMAAAPLLSPSCLSAGLCVLGVAVARAERLGLSSIPGVSTLQKADAGVGSMAGEAKNRPKFRQAVDLRVHVWALLAPLIGWLDDRQQATLRSICSRTLDLESAMATRMQICALKADGPEIDPWYLLEGYGRGAEEQAAIPPEAFAFQGVFDSKATDYFGSKTASKAEAPSVTRLKRTYSTYACMAVR